MLIVCLILGVVIFSYIMFILPTKWLKIERIHLNLGINKKALQISDIHINNLRVSLNRLKKVIAKENPDYLFLTGDFIDKTESEFELLGDFLNVIKEFKIETYAVLGNHDRYIDENKIINLLQQKDIKVLMNENIDKSSHYIIGIDDYCTKNHDIEKSFENINDEKTKIVITHDPNIVDILNKKYDYLMAGHLHGKQVNIPLLFKIKNMGLLPKRGIYKGLHTNRFGKFYISKGISQSRHNIRFLVRSEITVHYL